MSRVYGIVASDKRADFENCVVHLIMLSIMAIAFITPTTTTIQPMITTHVITRSHHDHYTLKNIPHHFNANLKT